MITKLTYNEVLELAPPVGSYSSYKFQSSCHDPNLTAVGHQPLWWDQMKLLYNRYRVYGFRYSFKVLADRDVTTAVACIVGNSSYVPSPSLQTEMERQNCRGKGFIHKYGKNQIWFRGYVDVAKLEGLSKKEFAGHEDYEAAVGSSPVKTAVVTVAYQSQDTTSGRIMVMTTLQYYVELFDKISISGS